MGKVNSLDVKYKELIKNVLNNGIVKKDRTGTGTISIFDYTIKHNMEEGFPLLTSKEMFHKGIVHELVWFLKGNTNIKYLLDNKVNIWNGDCYKNYLKKCNSDEILEEKDFFIKMKNDKEFSSYWGELGPIYGKQWTSFGPNQINQIEELINTLKNNPDSRRMLVSAWDPSSLDEQVLPPCHYGFQCYTYEMSSKERIEEWCKSINKDISYGEKINDSYLNELNFPTRKISLKWTQRSVDICLGLPYNFASYGLLLELLAKEVNMISNQLIFTGGDCHIYSNHTEGSNKQLKQRCYDLPQIKLNNSSFENFEFKDFELINYESSNKIFYPLSN